MLTRVLQSARGRQKSLRDRSKKRESEMILLASEMKEGATYQRIPAAPRIQKKTRKEIVPWSFPKVMLPC